MPVTHPEEFRRRAVELARLREKLRDDQSQPAIILTVRGKGYMFGSDERGTMKDE